MELIIKQYSTMPYLKLRLQNEGRYDYGKFYEKLENSAVTFNMTDTSGVYKIASKPADIVLKTKRNSPDEKDEYYLIYKWTKSDTDTPGLYKCEFLIQFFGEECGTLLVPFGEDLFVRIKESFTRYR